MEAYLKDIRIAYQFYIKEMNVIYDELFTNVNYIKENYSTGLADAVLEGFWDTMKKGAHSVGKFVGSGVKKGEELVGKAKELGNRALEAGKNLMTKIGGALNKAKSYILSTPGKLYDYMSGLWTQVKQSTSELYQDAKSKGGGAIEQAKSIIKDTYNKVIASIKGELLKLKDWAIKNWDKFVEILKAKKAEWLEIAQIFAQRGKEEYTEISNVIKNMFTEIGKGIAKGAKWSAIGVLLLVWLPIYGAYKGGEAGVNALVAVWDSIKTNAPEVYQAFKAGYAQGRNVQPVAQTTERKVMNFEMFVNEKKEEEKEGEEKKDKKNKPISKKQAAFFKKMGWDKKKK